MLTLFDTFQRKDSSPALQSETQFRFLNRSARPEFARVRDALGEWFERYPPSECEALCARFRSNGDNQHRSAFFELFIHELLLRLGCKVTVHPTVGGISRQPDFLVDCSTGGRFYIEAVLATNQPETERAAEARMNQIVDALNRMESPDFFVGIGHVKQHDVAPSARRIRSFLRRQLALLDPDKVLEDHNAGVRRLPRWRYTDGPWEIEFYAIPKSRSARGKPGRPIINPSRMKWVTGKAIADAVSDKGHRYGRLRLPFIVAVNVLDPLLDREDIAQGLFGGEATDGAWRDSAGPRYTRVSGALITSPILPWHIADAPICLYHNPWARHPCCSELNRLPQTVFDRDELKWIAGQQLAGIMGLPEGWPGQSGVT